MTEPQFDGAPSEAPPVEVPPTSDQLTEEPRRGRGRPRARETLERDEAVINVLRDEGPMTRERLSERLNQPSSLVYLALWRLSHQDPPKVVRVSDGGTRHAWQIA